MKLAIVTDAWKPQVNGVVTTFRNITKVLTRHGHEPVLITPDQFNNIPCPGYSEIRLAVSPYRRVERMLRESQPYSIHIATEGPLGWAARRFCLRHDIPFATSLHTRFPEYIRMRAPVPVGLGYRFLRRYHAPARCTLVRTRSQRDELAARGFRNLKIWPGAVDTELFRPRGKSALDYPRPISMYMGRVAIEKGLESFLDLTLPGTQVIIGDGPDREGLQSKYPAARFLGARHGDELAAMVSAADVFVFPSRTDTFGLTMLEAMACGVPAAAFPVPGPRDVILQGSTGIMDEDLESAIFQALQLDASACIDFAMEHSWERSTERFIGFQTPLTDWQSPYGKNNPMRLFTSLS